MEREKYIHIMLGADSGIDQMITIDQLKEMIGGGGGAISFTEEEAYGEHEISKAQFDKLNVAPAIKVGDNTYPREANGWYANMPHDSLLNTIKENMAGTLGYSIQNVRITSIFGYTEYGDTEERDYDYEIFFVLKFWGTDSSVHYGMFSTEF